MIQNLIYSLKSVALLSAVVLCMAATAWAQTGQAVVKSPDGRLVVTFQTVEKDQPAPSGGQLVYSVTFQGKPLIDDSALGLDLQGFTAPWAGT